MVATRQGRLALGRRSGQRGWIGKTRRSYEIYQHVDAQAKYMRLPTEKDVSARRDSIQQQGTPVRRRVAPINCSSSTSTADHSVKDPMWMSAVWASSCWTLVSGGRLHVAEMAVPVHVSANADSNAKDNSNDFNSIYNRTFWRAEELKAFSEKARAERKEQFLNRQQQQPNQKETLRNVYEKFPKAPAGKVEFIPEASWRKIQQTQQDRGLSWFGGGSFSGSYGNYGGYNHAMVDPSQFYDKWAQAYRMLGGFIDCDHDKSQNSRDNKNNNNGNGNNNNKNGNNNYSQNGCSRWMLWASVSIVALRSRRLMFSNNNHSQQSCTTTRTNSGSTSTRTIKAMNTTSILVTIP
jgi:hypothetical protein